MCAVSSQHVQAHAPLGGTCTCACHCMPECDCSCKCEANPHVLRRRMASACQASVVVGQQSCVLVTTVVHVARTQTAQAHHYDLRLKGSSRALCTCHRAWVRAFARVSVRVRCVCVCDSACVRACVCRDSSYFGDQMNGFK